MNRNVRRQKIEDFTIQICDCEDETRGTGIVVSTDGKIITCAHVVQAVLGMHPREAIGQEIKVYFSQDDKEDKKSRTAVIVGGLNHYDDDIVLLKLNDGLAPLEQEQIAVLGKADGSQDNEFYTYGYAPIGPYISSHARGYILGPVEINLPRDMKLRTKLIELKADDILPGLSGGAVLDKQRNLVVGIVTERWNSANEQVINKAWATDNFVLTFDPINLPLRDDPLPLSPASSPNVDFKKDIKDVAPIQKYSWNKAPPLVNEWVGRDDLFRSITNEWIESKTKIIGLIGFGGEGKSSLARQWVDNLLKNKSLSQPEGIFWWGFYESSNVDEFFESALRYMSGENIELSRKLQSSLAKAHFLASMLYEGRYLLILDGLEKVQLKGSDYGSLASNSMKEFLKFLAHPDNKSFCIITSRAPVTDLEEYVTYVHQNVSGLSLTEGCNLLERLGVKASSEELKTVVEEWKGYALALALIGSCSSDLCGGNISYLYEISKPLGPEDRYGSINNILNYYNQHLSKIQKEFLTIFSAFRLPVDKKAISEVFQNISKYEIFDVVISSPNNKKFSEVLDTLKNGKILRYDQEKENYVMHPLIQKYYSKLLEEEETKFLIVHCRIKDYYLKITDIPIEPTLEDLKYSIEAVHHACCSKDYIDAWRIYTNYVCPPENYTLTDKLGAYETTLSIMKDFFPNGDLNKEPLIDDRLIASLILGQVGFSLMSLGNLKEAASFYERANKVYLEIKKWRNLSYGYQNLARLYIYLGELKLSKDASHKAESAARSRQKGRQKKEERRSNQNLYTEKARKKSLLNSWCWFATVHHLTGDLGQAKKYFEKAEEMNREINQANQYLDGFRGIQYADYWFRCKKYLLRI